MGWESRGEKMLKQYYGNDGDHFPLVTLVPMVRQFHSFKENWNAVYQMIKDEE